MRVVPFEIEHLHRLKLQPNQHDALLRMSDMEEAYLAASEFAFTGLDGEEVVACAGIVKMWEGRGHAWALLSGNIGNRFVRVHRAVKRAVEVSGYHRVEMVVDSDFPAAIKWAEKLGFRCETPDGMPGYYNDGRLYKLFARII